MEEFVTIARIAKTQGRRGEVAADILTDFPERFAMRKRLFVGPAKQRRELVLEDHWFHKGRVVLKFAGVDSISDAETLVGNEVVIPASERAELEAGTVYVSDLAGCAVFDNGNYVGTVDDVQFGAGEAPTLVVKQGNREFLIPFVEGFIERLDIEAHRLEMKLPEGLLELDAPLTQEEKRMQAESNKSEGEGEVGP